MNKNSILLNLLLLFGIGYSQAPQQDCINAISVCSNIYNEPNSYSGFGDINEGASMGGLGCLNYDLFENSSERNSVWYRINVSQSGNINFVISPNDLSDDYDWALFSLNNNTCANILNGSNTPVSCNYSGDVGTTGISTIGTVNSQGAGGTTFNRPFAVLAGQTYVLLVNNYAGSTNGYNLNFSTSTASIFDITPPTISAVVSPNLGATNLAVTFSENIDCSTVQAGDFTLTSPNGIITNIVSISSSECNSGASSSKNFSLTLANPIVECGSYRLELVQNVTDNCGNNSLNGSFVNFNTNGIPTLTMSSTPNSSCDSITNGNGTATVTLSGGVGTVVWSYQNLATNTITNLSPGKYVVTVTSAGNCIGKDSVMVVNNPQCLILTVINSTANNRCDSLTNGNGSATLASSLNVAASNVQWYFNINGNWVLTSNSGLNANQLRPGRYRVIADDPNGIDTVFFTIPSTITPLTFTTDSLFARCDSNNAMLRATVQTGIAPYTFTWSNNAPNPINTATSTQIRNLAPFSSYSLTITDSRACSASRNYTTVKVPTSKIKAFYTADTCGTDSLGSAYVRLIPTGDVTIFNIQWDDYNNSTTDSITQLPFGKYRVTVIDTNNCTLKDSVVVPILKNVLLPNFVTSPTFANTDNPSFNFVNLTSPAGSAYIWNFGDGDTSHNAIPYHLYGGAGTYAVKLTAFDQYGCEYDTTGYITVNYAPTFYTGNAFTPGDNNGVNDIFKPSFTEIDHEYYNFKIFDRWGHLVFETNNIDAGWNGKLYNEGNLLDFGSYNYIITYRGLDLEQKVKKGIVHLLK